ncbi:hypothetical protein D9M68_862120 [compost metagenome]
MRPSEPWMRSTLSRLIMTAQETWATMPFSKLSTAAAQSSVPSALSVAVPRTLIGSAKGLPMAAPAMKRAIDTG